MTRQKIETRICTLNEFENDSGKENGVVKILKISMNKKTLRNT